MWLTFDSVGRKKRKKEKKRRSRKLRKRHVRKREKKEKKMTRFTIGFYAFVRDDVVSRLSLGNNESRRK